MVQQTLKQLKFYINLNFLILSTKAMQMHLNGKMKSTAAVLTLLLACTVFPTLAQNDNRNKALITSVPFLALTPDSRSGGLGEAGVALSGDVYSAFWNPARLAWAEKPMAAALSITPWLQALGITDMYIGNLAGYKKIRKQDAIGITFNYFAHGKMTLTDINGNVIRDVNPNEVSIGVTYSRQLSKKLSVGVTPKFFRSDLLGGANISGANFTTQPVNSVCVDLGGLWKTEMDISGTPSILSLGASISNFGPNITYGNPDLRNSIPTMVRLGGALTTEADPYNRFTFTVDASKLAVPTPGAKSENGGWMNGFFTSFYEAPGGASEKLSEVILSGGVEYWYDNLLAIRAGYFNEAKDKGNRKFVTFGAGLRYQKFGIDMAYIVGQGQLNPLNNTLRFSIMVEFDNASKPEESIDSADTP